MPLEGDGRDKPSVIRLSENAVVAYVVPGTTLGPGRRIC